MTQLIYWHPLHDLGSLPTQLDRLFDEFSQTPNISSVKSEVPAIAWQPLVEMKNAPDAIVLRVEVPGVEGKDLDVQASRNAVAIAGEYRPQQGPQNGAFRSEFRYGRFHRIVELSEPVLNEQIQANLKNGILTLTLPKVSAAHPAVVKVNLSEPETAQPAEPPSESGQIEPLTDAELLGDVWASNPAA